MYELFSEKEKIKKVTKTQKIFKVLYNVANYLLDPLSLFSINIELEFEYYDSSSRYEKINKDYPRYIKEENIKEVDVTFDHDEDECEDEQCSCHHHDEDEPNPADRADLDYDDPNQIYLGNAFEGFEEKLEKAKKENK